MADGKRRYKSDRKDYKISVKLSEKDMDILKAALKRTRMMLSVKLDAPAPCRLDAPDLDLIYYASADCLHQHLQVI